MTLFNSKLQEILNLILKINVKKIIILLNKIFELEKIFVGLHQYQI